MIGKVFISSTIVIALIFLASSIENSKSNIKEAKQIQEHYEIVKDIKTQIALKYNINPENITRDDIIAHLPKGENWEKILLLDREKNSHIKNKEFINSSANIEISEDEKIKLLALKAKLKDSIDVNNLETKDNKVNMNIAYDVKSLVKNEEVVKKSVEQAVTYLYVAIFSKSVTGNGVVDSQELDKEFDKFLVLLDKPKGENEFVPFDYMVFDLDNTITDEEKISNFKEKVKIKLLENRNGREQYIKEYIKENIKDKM